MTIDLTAILVAIIGGVSTIVGTMFLAWLRVHMKDDTAAATLGNAVTNSLGALQQAAQAEIVSHRPQIQLPGVPEHLAPAVQYVLDHAGEEAARFGITPRDLAEKVAARIGLAAIQTNIATAASPAASPAPLDPLPATGATA
jgi:hypothetical protein